MLFARFSGTVLACVRQNTPCPTTAAQHCGEYAHQHTQTGDRGGNNTPPQVWDRNINML